MSSYDEDIVAWANEQAQLLRARRFDLLDLEHIAEEIEDVGKSEQRELSKRMAKLLAYLLKWEFQPGRQSTSGQRAINEQRKSIKNRLTKCPGLQTVLMDDGWRSLIWSDAVSQAADETGQADFPDDCPWLFQGQVLLDGWLPS